MDDEELIQALEEAVTDWRTQRPGTGSALEDRGRQAGLEEAASHLEEILEEYKRDA